MTDAAHGSRFTHPNATDESKCDDDSKNLILSNYKRLDLRIAQAEQSLSEGMLELAAFEAMLAATIATHAHCGVFASKRLELVIRGISEKLDIPVATKQRKTYAKDIKRVLHVATEVSPVGGLSRMISRWINADPDRSNSLAITRYREKIPNHLTEAVHSSGGTLHLLNLQFGSLLDWVKDLSRISADYDLIVLHTHCEDVLPLITFALGEKHPPTLLLNHADHLFWLGTGSAHAVLNLRDAANQITRDRRGVATERSLMLPTLIDDTTRRQSKSNARRSLGIGDEELVLISVARGTKYKSRQGPSYADRFVPVLNQNRNTRLFVVGSGMPESWKEAEKATGGRIVGLPEQPDPWVYFEAADIYIDSYPFSSSTSLMEAAGYGLPLVTLFTAPDDARIVGINHLGLEGGLLQTRSEEDWENAITRLLTDDAFRKNQGALAKEAVKIAQPEEWKNWLERTYQDSLSLPPLRNGAASMPDETDTPRFGEPDRRHQSIYGSDASLDNIEQDYIGLLSLKGRIHMVRKLHQNGQLESGIESSRLIVPGWLKARIRLARNG